MEIGFTHFQPDHSDYVWLTYVTEMKSLIQKIWGWEESWQRENYATSLSIYSTYILTFRNQKIGYIQFNNNQNYIFLSMIVLEKKHQSKGFGPIIIDKIQGLIPELAIRLRCFKVNENAYKFYLENGFILIDSDNEFHTLSRGSKDT